MITESLNIPKTVALRIMKQDFGKRILCARFFPHSLTPEKREDRVMSIPQIGMKLEILHFAYVVEIKEAVTDEIKKVQKGKFSYDCTEACIYSIGAYFE